MKRRLLSRACLALAALGALGAHRVSAQGPTKPVEFLTSIPESPAFDYLDATPAKVQQPGHLRDFGVAILDGIGDDGQAKAGFAIDASVWNLVPGFDLPLEDYRRHWYSYALGNLQASLATARTAGDAADLRGAIGLKTVLYDAGYPLLDPEVTTKLAAGMATCAPTAPGAGQSAACVDSVVADIVGAHTRQRWNATQLAAAVALGTRFEDSRITRNRYDGVSASLIGSVGLGTRIQIIGQAGYKARTAVDTVPSYRAGTAGARLVMGSAVLNGFFEYAGEWRSADASSLLIEGKVGGWSAGLEFRLAENTWLSTGLGTQFDALGSPDRTAIFAGLRWGITSRSRLDELGG